MGVFIFSFCLELLKPEMLIEGIFFIAIFGLILYLVVGHVKSRLRSSTLVQLGSNPPMVPFRLPLGFDTLWEVIDVIITTADTDVVV